MFTKTLLLFLVWIAFTNSLDVQQLTLGFILSIIVAKFFTTPEDINFFSLVKKYIRFIPFFIKELILANIEIMKIILSKKIDIDPVVIKLKTTLDNDYDKLLLANSITLTPGTITLQLEENDIYVHVLDKKGQEEEYFQSSIIEKAEKFIKI